MSKPFRNYLLRMDRLGRRYGLGARLEDLPAKLLDYLMMMED